jgi:hypothetical protein
MCVALFGIFVFYVLLGFFSVHLLGRKVLNDEDEWETPEQGRKKF